MESLVVAAVVGGTLVLVGASIAAALVMHRKKVGRLTEWATWRGWAYAERDDSLRERFPGDPFVARRGRIRHAIRGGHRGRRFVFFEYSYTTSGGQSSTTHTFLVVAVPTPAPVPMLQVSSEHFGHKLLGVIGVQDLQLGYPPFDDQFRIKTDNEGFARAFLNADMMNWLLADPRAPAGAFRIAGSDILAWWKRPLDTENALGMLDYLADILDRAPRAIWHG